MNSNQFTILTVAVILFLMTILSPPWVYEDHSTSAEHSAGHHLFNRPPEIKSDAEMREIFSLPENDSPHGFSVKTDILRLFGEWLAILFSAVGGLFLAVKRRTPIMILFGGFSISIGLFFTLIAGFLNWK